VHGDYETIDGRPALRFERRLAHPPERVWRAITEPDELAQWFPSSVEADLRLGGAMHFEFQGAEMTLDGEITELEPCRRFSFLWGDDHLHFEIEPTEHGSACVLRLVVELDQREKAARDAAGWDVTLDRLAAALGGGAADRETEDWRARYEEYQRRGLPTGAPLPDGA
jgi:uncharacterized protein YndB with AHSA1/START domain